MLYLLLVVVFSRLARKWWLFLLIGYGEAGERESLGRERAYASHPAALVCFMARSRISKGRGEGIDDEVTVIGRECEFES